MTRLRRDGAPPPGAGEEGGSVEDTVLSRR
jgi:hypothetical protein